MEKETHETPKKVLAAGQRRIYWGLLKRIGCLGFGITHQRHLRSGSVFSGDGGLQEKRQELLGAATLLLFFVSPSSSSLFTTALAPFLTFALVIDGAAHGHTDKAEGIESSPKEEDGAGP